MLTFQQRRDTILSQFAQALQQFPVRVRAYPHKSIIMKVEIPDYFLKSFIRHFERITENCKASPSDIKTSEALRLGKKDVIKLKRFINKKV